MRVFLAEQLAERKGERNGKASTLEPGNLGCRAGRSL